MPYRHPCTAVAAMPALPAAMVASSRALLLRVVDRPPSSGRQTRITGTTAGRRGISFSTFARATRLRCSAEATDSSSRGALGSSWVGAGLFATASMSVITGKPNRCQSTVVVPCIAHTHASRFSIVRGGDGMPSSAWRSRATGPPECRILGKPAAC